MQLTWSQFTAEIRPKYSKEPVVHDNVMLYGYTYYTNIDSEGRVLMVFIAEHLATIATLIDFGNDFKESFWLELKLNDHNRTKLCRSPSSPPDNDLLLRNVVYKVNNRGTSRVMVVVHEINWEMETTSKSINHSSQKLQNAVRDVSVSECY